MMKPITLFLVLFATGTQLHAQSSLDSLYSAGTRWYERAWFNAGLGTFSGFSGTYTIVADSLAGGATYHIIANTPKGKPATTMGYISVNSEQVLFVNTTIDTIFSRRLYMEMPGGSQAPSKIAFPPGEPVLLYDYWVQVNDVIPWYDSAVVTGIDSIVVNGRYLKRIELNNGDEYWLEGIGSSKGFFRKGVLNLNGTYTPYTGWGYHVCYTNPRVTYINPNYNNYPPYNQGTPQQLSCDDLANEVWTSNVEEVKLNELSIYPNPLIGNILNINADTALHIASLYVTDMAGNTLFTSTGKVNTQIMLDLPQGVYTVKAVFHDGKIGICRVVKL